MSVNYKLVQKKHPTKKSETANGRPNNARPLAQKTLTRAATANTTTTPIEMKAAEIRRNSLIDIHMEGETFTAYGRWALILHAIYPQLPLRYVTDEEGRRKPRVTDIPKGIIREVCRKYQLVEAAENVIDSNLR